MGLIDIAIGIYHSVCATLHHLRDTGSGIGAFAMNFASLPDAGRSRPNGHYQDGTRSLSQCWVVATCSQPQVITFEARHAYGWWR